MKNFDFDIRILSKDKWQIIGLAILIIGLILSVYLVQQIQNYRSKADQEILNAFEITDEEGKLLEIEGDAYKTQSLDVKIKVKDLQDLTE